MKAHREVRLHFTFNLVSVNVSSVSRCIKNGRLEAAIFYIHCFMIYLFQLEGSLLSTASL